MTPGRGRLHAAILAGLLALPGAATAQAAAEGARLEAMRERAAALQRALNETREARDTERAELARLDGAIARQHTLLHRVAQDIRAEERRLALLEKGRRHERVRQEAGRRELARLAPAVLIAGETPPLRILFQSDPTRATRQLAYFGYVARARATELRGLERRLAELAREAAARAHERARLTGLQQQAAEEQRGLEARRRDRAQLLHTLDRRLQARHDALTNLKRDTERLERLFHGLQARPARRAPTRAAAPAAGLPVAGELVARFGAVRGHGDLRWNGVFVGAPVGSPVAAAASGRVVYADWLRGYGLLLIIDHGNGYMTLYGHNDGLAKGVGEQVQRHEIIARSGNTGGPPQPGLYFELRRQGEPVDPLAAAPGR